MKRRALALLFLTLGVLALAGGDAPAPAPAPKPAPPGFEGRTGPARARLALSNTFYLELAITEKELRICHSGIAVGTYPLQEVSVGYPRILWVSRRPLGEWVDDLWTGVRLDPAKVVQRVKIVPGDTATIPTPDKPGVIPPTLEELTPVPQDFAIRCEGDRAIFLHLEGPVPGALLQEGVRTSRWNDFLEALGLRTSESLRIRARISAADGAAFFRSFPEDTPVLLVLP